MIKFSAKYLNFKDTLSCGQVFRFKPYKKGYLINAKNSCAYVYNENGFAYILGDESFHDYFDLDRDYAKIIEDIKKIGNEKLSFACQKYSGIRILKQDYFETLISFIISQNNNIPRIKSSIEKLCQTFGEKFIFLDVETYSFPTSQALANSPLEKLKELGLGYRAEYVKETANLVEKGCLDLEKLALLDTSSLKTELLKLKGVGEKVCNCVMLFGFSKTDSFPVDTWVEKVYYQDFLGKKATRQQITKFFIDLFKDNSGFVQQYLFHAKRMNDF